MLDVLSAVDAYGMNAPESANRAGDGIMRRIVDQAINLEDGSLFDWVVAHGVLLGPETVKDAMTMAVPTLKILGRLLGINKGSCLARGIWQ